MEASATRALCCDSIYRKEKKSLAARDDLVIRLPDVGIIYIGTPRRDERVLPGVLSRVEDYSRSQKKRSVSERTVHTDSNPTVKCRKP